MSLLDNMREFGMFEFAFANLKRIRKSSVYSEV